MKNLVHFGAGNIGKSLIVPIFAKNNFKITLIEANNDVVKTLKESHDFRIYSTSNKNDFEKIENFKILHIDEKEDVLNRMLKASVITTSIGTLNLKHLINVFQEYIYKKNQTNDQVNIICVENGLNVSSKFKEMLNIEIKSNIAFVDCIADKICVKSSEIRNQDVLAEDFFDISVDKNQWLGNQLVDINYFDDLEPVTFRKLWMLNSTHSLIAWLLWDENKNIFEIKKEKIKEKIIKKYMNLIVNVIVNDLKKFDFNESQEYKNKIYSRFIDENIPDSPKRVGRNFKIKVSPGERYTSLFEASKNKKDFLQFLIMIYKLNEYKGMDKIIQEYTKIHGISKSIKKFSNIDILSYISKQDYLKYLKNKI